MPKKTARFQIPKHSGCAEQVARARCPALARLSVSPARCCALSPGEDGRGAVPRGPQAAARPLAQAEVAGTSSLLVLAFTAPPLRCDTAGLLG